MSNVGQATSSSTHRGRRWSRLDAMLAGTWLLLSGASFGGAWRLLSELQPEQSPWVAAYAALTMVTGSMSVDDFAHYSGQSAALFACVVGGTVSIIIGAGGVLRLVMVVGKGRRLWVKDHVVILGGGRVGRACLTAINEINESGGARRIRDVVFVDKVAPVLGTMRGLRLTLLDGDMSDAMLLRRANVERARFVIAATGDDLQNLRAADAVRELVEVRGGTLVPTLVRLGSHHLYRHVRERAGPKSPSGTIPFDVFTSAARAAVAAAWSDANPTETRWHLVICGFGRFGQAIARAAVAESRARGAPCVVEIDVIDHKAKQLVDEFWFAAGGTDDRASLTPMECGILSQNVWHSIVRRHAKDETCVFICTDKDEANIAYGAAVAEQLASQRESAPKTHIFVRQPQAGEALIPGGGALKFTPVVGEAVVAELIQRIRDVNDCAGDVDRQVGEASIAGDT